MNCTNPRMLELFPELPRFRKPTGPEEFMAGDFDRPYLVY